MAKIIFICSRDGSQDPSFPKNFQALCERLTPDNISPPPAQIIQGNGIDIGVFNPCTSLPIENQSVCLGNLIQPQEDWWKPRAEIPDGTYALFRGDRDTVEIASDMLATRTIWFFQTEHKFFASTSQRAILYFLRGFEPNEEAFKWMLSSGTLGPGFSWDSRIKPLAGNMRLVLDRSTWKTTAHREPVAFTPQEISDEDHEDKLQKAIGHVFENLGLDFSRWILTLSGGIDSRAILLFLKNHENLKCMTWGLKSSMQDKKNDAYIARRITQHFGLEHEYFETDLSDEPFESILGRFLITGEGRTDNIAGYMDGFRIWKYLFESRYQGILRGDIAFGNHATATPKEVIRNVGLYILSDFENLAPIAGTIEHFHQERPARLEQQEHEDLEDWRDRLNAEFEIPVLIAPLNDIKLSFVEVVNPFLSRSIVQQVRRLPENLRTDKKLFKKIVASLTPRIPYAQHRAIGFTRDCLKYPEVVEFIREELSSDYAKTLLPEALIDFVLQNIKTSTASISTKRPLLLRILKPMTPKIVRKWKYSSTLMRTLDLNTLGFRACLICRMTKILSEDANALS